MPLSVRRRTWSVARIVPLLAGSLVLLSVVLAVTISPWSLVLTTLVGANLVFYSVAGWCPATLLMTRLGVPAEPATCPTGR
ncbi:YgaP-like transmembrane domain [Nocardia stercoris]|uniref:DUF2892 domain-containing protein n=1 Tax=Nocardia stercoris TaxID=2483361 RepID=A0A3M2L793_9NOCA|nr:YgaP-like transmembrane domain [Nocardia stercoris]RMI32600.1 DUF2892 domain-containing protein [Nocardia stercoris]